MTLTLNVGICRLPSADRLSQSAVQLTFKKLMTMSKSFLCEQLMEPSGRFCQECIAEREVPLTFKLQFLEETAEEKRKRKSRRHREKKALAATENPELKRQEYDNLILHQYQEVSNFWEVCSICLMGYV